MSCTSKQKSMQENKSIRRWIIDKTSQTISFHDPQNSTQGRLSDLFVSRYIFETKRTADTKIVKIKLLYLWKFLWIEQPKAGNTSTKYTIDTPSTRNLGSHSGLLSSTKKLREKLNVKWNYLRLLYNKLRGFPLFLQNSAVLTNAFHWRFMNTVHQVNHQLQKCHSTLLTWSLFWNETHNVKLTTNSFIFIEMKSTPVFSQLPSNQRYWYFI